MKPLLIGTPQAVGNGLLLIEFDNLDATQTANFSITQAWFDNPTPGRDDTYLLIGYNWDTNGGRKVAGEPAIGFQIESYVNGGTPLVEAHLTIITAAGINRPWSNSTIIGTGESDLSFSNRFFIVNDQNAHTLIHAAYGSSVNVGIGTVANSNDALHVKGKELWESPSGTANNKFWDIDYGAGDSFILRAVNDAYGAAGTVFQVNRSGATVAAMYIYPPLGIGSSGDAFFSRKAAKTVGLDSDGVGTYDTTLILGTVDFRGVDAAGASGGTLTNAPSAGNPARWIPVKFNGTTYKIPAWT